MKTISLLAFMILSMSVFASDISPKALGAIEARIALQKELLNEKTNALHIQDITEGKIVASMIAIIEEKLDEASKDLAAIDTDEELNEENFAKINALLDESEKIIESI